MPRSWLSPFGETKPDLEPLRHALAACAIPSEKIPATIKRLIRPPLSIGQSATDDQQVFSDKEIQMGAAKETGRIVLQGPDRDIAARMLRLNRGCPDATATWKTLSRTERKQAERLWNWTRDWHGLRVTQQGRPPKLDPALVLYCARVLGEASSKSFGFSRPPPPKGGLPTGPMWHALMEALPLAQLFLARRFGTPVMTRAGINPHAETIAEIIKVARLESFQMGGSADDVASPTTFRLAIAFARKSRDAKRRARAAKGSIKSR
jgi:hypothetical protein